ncbi:hypothetical protein M798_04585 [Brucella melitensis ADMAS-G1]|nr:hypothetical protein M798_04585 [Brucella melitensis ADMAS-G1]
MPGRAGTGLQADDDRIRIHGKVVRWNAIQLNGAQAVANQKSCDIGCSGKIVCNDAKAHVMHSCREV